MVMPDVVPGFITQVCVPAAPSPVPHFSAAAGRDSHDSGDAVAWCGANAQFNKEGLPRPVVTTVAVRWGGAVLTTLRGLLAHGHGGF
jgi:hypothetical protein